MRMTQFVAALLRHGMAGSERQDPKAQLEIERECLRRLMAQYDRGLAAHSRLAEYLMSRNRSLEQEEVDLRARTLVQVRVGSRADAARTALQLQAVRRELAASREQLGHAAATHESLEQARALAVAAAKARIEIIRPPTDDARRAMAELDDMASVDRGSQTLGQLRTMAKQQHDQGIAPRTPGRDDPKAREAERAALEDFLAQDGGLVVEIGRRDRPRHHPIDGAGIPFMPIDWNGRD